MRHQVAKIEFADRLAALVTERRSQVCLGLDPDPNAEPWSSALSLVDKGAGDSVRERVAAAIERVCRELIDLTGGSCVAIKPQLARFEALGSAGWAALEAVTAAATEAGLLVVADGKRGDVPVSAGPYADAIIGSTATPLGEVAGLGADALTVNPLMGRDSIEPIASRAKGVGAGVFVLVRTSNPGATDFLDLAPDGGAVHEHIARALDELAGEPSSECGLSHIGAVVGATEPRYIARLRELMPHAILLLPGLGAQGGQADALEAAFSTHPAAGLVPSSRSIVGAPDPAAAAESLRAQIWSLGGG